MTATCKVCKFQWTGIAPCHCSRCHHTFSAITAFDAHQVKNKTKCLDPVSDPKFTAYRPGIYGIASDGTTTDAP